MAPIWDGNETWLVLGGIGLFAAFPLAFAIIIPAMYFPILADAARPHLPRRGVRVPAEGGNAAASCGTTRSSGARSSPPSRRACVLGAYVQGFEVRGASSRVSVLDWVHPFPLAVGVGLIFGYVLLGCDLAAS